MKKINDLEELKKLYDVPDAAIDFVRQLNAKTPNGRYDFGEDCFVLVSSYESKRLQEDMRLEAHEKYIDVQYLAVGAERIFHTDKQTLTVTDPYNAQKDIAFYHLTTAQEVQVRAGEAVILDTNEAHLPNVAIDTPVFVQKAVIKLKKR